MCYHSDFTFQDAMSKYRMLRDTFMAKDSINNFHAFDQYVKIE